MSPVLTNGVLNFNKAASDVEWEPKDSYKTQSVSFCDDQDQENKEVCNFNCNLNVTYYQLKIFKSLENICYMTLKPGQ